jgi:hypothetical protein
MKTINFAKDFTDAPGGRYRTDGMSSAEEFRETILAPALKDAIQTQTELLVDMDGCFGFPWCFLEEVFGGLIRAGLRDFRHLMKIKSDEYPPMITIIWQFITDAESGII